MLRVYLMPATGVGTRADPRRPKYSDTDLAGTATSNMDGGNENLFLVVADVSVATHLLLVAHADVVAAPADLTQQVGAGLVATKAALESLGIPAGWVLPSMTYATVVRGVATLFQFLQRLQMFTAAQILASGITLDSTFSQLPAGARTALQNAAADLGYVTTALTGASTIRQCFKAMMDQWQPNILIGGITL